MSIAQNNRVVPTGEAPKDAIAFQISKKGLLLSMFLPKEFKNTDDICIKCELTNSTGAPIVFSEMFGGALDGIRFEMDDSAGKKIPYTDAGRLEMGHFAMEFYHQTLRKNQTIVISAVLSKYLALKSLGTYTLKVSWGEDKPSDDPYINPRPATLALSGLITLEKVGGKVRILRN